MMFLLLLFSKVCCVQVLCEVVCKCGVVPCSILVGARIWVKLPYLQMNRSKYTKLISPPIKLVKFCAKCETWQVLKDPFLPNPQLQCMVQVLWLRRCYSVLCAYVFVFMCMYVHVRMCVCCMCMCVTCYECAIGHILIVKTCVSKFILCREKWETWTNVRKWIRFRGKGKSESCAIFTFLFYLSLSLSISPSLSLSLSRQSSLRTSESFVSDISQLQADSVLSPLSKHSNHCLPILLRL